jgi:hypothetical protein
MNRVGGSFIVAMVILTLLPAAGHADTTQSSTIEKISLQIVSSDTNGNYGYKLQYYVSAPIKTFWHFKTDFETDILLTSDELIGHRLVKTAGNSVITENRYATAPGLRFLWQTPSFRNHIGWSLSCSMPRTAATTFIMEQFS